MLRKQLTVFHIATLLLCSSREMVMDKEAYDIATNLCPYTNFCFKSAKISALSLMKYPSEIQPCCNQCSCDDYCWKIRNCCPDKSHKNDTTPHIIGRCTSSQVDEGEKTRTYNHFRVIDTCGYVNYTTQHKSKCEGEASSIEEFVWVSDSVNGEIFRNRYCALCNEVATYVPWNIWTTCRQLSYQSFLSFKESISPQDKCRADEIFDSIMNLCRVVICPDGSAPYKGKCKKFMIWLEWAGVNSALFMRVVPEHSNLLTATNGKEGEINLGNLVYKEIENRLDYKFCIVCLSALRVVHENSTNRVVGFIFWTNFLVHNRCTSPSMKNQFDELNGKQIRVIVNEVEHILVDVIYETRPYSAVLTESEEMIEHTGRCNLVEKLETRLETDFRFQGDICAQIELVYGEIESLTILNERNRFASFFGGAEDLENTTRVKVCIDDYMIQNSAARPFKSQTYFMVNVLCFFLILALRFPSKK